jgi:hypothetical protein
VSLSPSLGGMAEWLCSGLQSRVPRFDSGSRLHHASQILFQIMALAFSNRSTQRAST